MGSSVLWNPNFLKPSSTKGVDVTMSGTITLLCWVIDTPIKQIFPVEVGHDAIWGKAKKAIKEDQKPEFDDIASKTLDLWKVRHCAISHVVMLNSQFKRSPSIVPNVPSWNQKTF
jgi:hypothetical protein